MLKVFFFIVYALCFMAKSNYAQWNGKNCAVALTYDDALNVHLDNAIPLLDSLALKATFYLSGYSGVLDKRLNEWRNIASNGHELGNHTLYHPCQGGRPGREFVKPEYDLNNYTVKRIDDEIIMTNTLLRAIDGKTSRTFAYPCGDTKIDNQMYIVPLKDQFAAARGVTPHLDKPGSVDLYNMGCYTINGQSGAEMIALVKKAMEEKSLITFLFHGVGGEHGLNVSLSAHRELLQFLKENEKTIWIAPVVDIAAQLKRSR